MKKFAFLLIILQILFTPISNVFANESLKISVIVPVYNVENYLRQCIESIINQSFKNLEIICVNDGSTDSSFSILEEYKAKDGRIKLVNQQNQGVSSARNKGIELSTGKYISFVDPDDYLEKDAFQIASDNLGNFDLDILSWGYNPFPNPSQWYIKASSPTNKIYKDDSANAYFNGGASVIVWNKLYKTEIIKKNSLLFNENLKMSEDVDFNMMAFIFSNNIKFISNKLYNYRINREGSLTNTYKAKMIAQNHKILFEHILHNWNNLGFLKSNESKILGYFIKMSYNVIKGLSEEDSKHYASELLRLFWNYMDENNVIPELSLDVKNKLTYIQNLNNIAVV